MKRLLTNLFFMAIAIWTMAVPADHVLRTVKQSDGTMLSVRLVGDEWHHGLITTDGLTVKRNSTGDYCYVTANNGLSTVIAHNAGGRGITEQAFISANASQLTMESQYTEAKKARRKSARPRKMAEVPNRGTIHVPVILVNFADKKFSSSNPLAVWGEIINGEQGTSVRQYFRDQSLGLFDPQFDLYGPYELPQNTSEYGGNDNEGTDQGLGNMVAQACLGLNDNIDFSKYDNNGDQTCDIVIILYAGGGEATTSGPGSEDLIWPCQWDLFSSEYRKILTLDNTSINKFAVFNELHGPTLDKEDGIGVMCHEFSHCLGLPDFYETSPLSHGYFGMSRWSLMDYGCYNNDTYTPCAYTAYERNFLGWMDIETPEPNTVYTIKSLDDGGKAYKIASDDPNEYYIVENIQQTGWNRYAAANGLQVTHVNYYPQRWEDNTPNNFKDQSMTIIPADNNLITSGGKAVEDYLVGDLYPYNGNNKLTATSTPAATLYRSTNNLDKPIYNITRNDDGTVSFFYMPDIPYAPTRLASSDTTATGFKAIWNKCEGADSYTLMVAQGARPTAKRLIRETFPSNKFPDDGSTDISKTLDNYMSSKGWTGSTLYTSKNGIRLGASAKTGCLVSPTLDLSESGGKVTVKLTAKDYGTDTNCGLKVSIGESVENLVIADKKPQNFTLLMNSPEAVGQNLTIESTANRKRVIISNIEIYSGDATSEMAPGLRSDDDIITITGITDTTYTVTGLKPATDYYFTVKSAFPVFDSDWSAKSFVTTLEVPKGDITGDGVVDVNDLNAVINVILGGIAAETYDGRADVTGDGAVDVNDLNTIINIILGVTN
ncbi:MAG: M6 family metalloprotease domain-containing protein [Bacteroidales bacterium]|nr:M6 family metalloprotease domain-containing protein [Candidatus Sodaliphilus aphodohippi]